MIVSFDHLEKITPSITSFWFKPMDVFDYLAGQYVEFNAFGETRWHTLSSSPSENMLALTTRFVEPISKFKKSLLKLKKNDQLSISAPLGDYVLPKDKSIPLVFLSGGIGITPVRSIVKWLVDNNEERSITLIYLVQNKEDLAYSDLFNNYDLIFYPIITGNSKNKLHKSCINFIYDSHPKSMFFVSGPQMMVETAVEVIAAKFNRSKIIMDYFPGYTSI